jgi:pyruvate,orthophosphate dikinase
MPEAGLLLGWARELGVPIRQPAPEPENSAASTPPEAVRPAPDACLRRVATKGFATTASLADALLSTPDAVQPILEQLVADGLTTSVAGAYRLTEAGGARAAELLAADREEWGVDEPAAALEAFHGLDQQMKEIVTAWQLKPSEGEPVVNDHSDADYDRSVLDRLAALHGAAAAWLQPLEGACGRLIGYRERLGRALERAVGGDQKYVASPRVDSYHGAWFELHEDLIGLAGRTRADETAAGRA